MLIMTLTILFGLLKLQHLLQRKNPSISKFILESALTVDDTYQLSSENNFQLAIAIENYYTGALTD